MQPGREVRQEMLITESLQTQNEMGRPEAAKWVPVGREDLRERFFRNSQHSEIKGKGKRYDSGREVAMKC